MPKEAKRSKPAAAALPCLHDTVTNELSFVMTRVPANFRCIDHRQNGSQHAAKCTRKKHDLYPHRVRENH